MAELPAAAPVGISKLVGELRLMVTLADSLDDRVEWLNALCAAVRAEAVADERQRVLTELHRPGFVQAAIDRACATHFTDDAGNDIGTMPASHAVVAIVAVATELAAGSVPVATPEERLMRALAEAGAAIEAMPHDWRFRRVDEALANLGLEPGPNNEQIRRFLIGVMVSEHDRRLVAGWAPDPVATPTEPADPTYGRIDPDIQRAVDALEPESIGSRVAMENTLQARRDAATPTEPAIDMGFLSFGADVEVDDLASPVAAVQPPAHDPGCERQLHNDWCLCVQRVPGRGEGWPS